MNPFVLRTFRKLSYLFFFEVMAAGFLMFFLPFCPELILLLYLAMGTGGLVITASFRPQGGL